MTKKKVLLLCGAAVLAAALTAGAVFGWKQFRQAEQARKAGIWRAGQHWGEALQNGGSAENGARLAEKIIALKNDYLTPDNRVFCGIIPDKGYYLQGSGAPKTNYEALLGAVESGLSRSGIQYINLTDCLSLDQYFTTDSHWKQESLQPVLDSLGNAMDFSVELSTLTPHSVEGFAGAYGKYGAKKADTLVYHTSDAIDAATTDNFQYPDVHSVYELDRLSSSIPYDVFLSGATPLVTITSPLAKTDRELIIFRDSYSSSLAPLLLEEYRTITLIDIRYMISSLLPQYVEFTDQDVLFLYSTLIADNSSILH